MNRTLLAFMLALCSVASVHAQCSGPFDSDNDGQVGITDLLGLLAVFGDIDSDGDGIWDSQDNCTDLSACNFSENPSQNCQWNDALNICGGDCPSDVDGDGICDEVYGCTVSSALCFDPTATVDDGSCTFSVAGWNTDLNWPCNDLDYYTVGSTTQADSCACGGGVAPVAEDGSGPCEGQTQATHFGDSYDLVEISGVCAYRENVRYIPQSGGINETCISSEWQWQSPPSDESPRVYSPYPMLGVDPCEPSAELDSIRLDGLLYNRWAVASWDLCPSGFHVMDDYDVDQMNWWWGGDGAVKAQSFYDGMTLQAGNSVNEYTYPTDYYGMNMKRLPQLSDACAGQEFQTCSSPALMWGGWSSDSPHALPEYWIGTEVDPYILSGRDFQYYEWGWEEFDYNWGRSISPRDGRLVRCIKDQ